MANLKKVCTKVRYVTLTSLRGCYAVINTADGKHEYHYSQNAKSNWARIVVSPKGSLTRLLKNDVGKLSVNPPPGYLPFIHPDKRVST